MKIILENPYRIVGLLAGASAREQDRQIRRLKQFVEAEQDIQDDFSFPWLGRFNRGVEDVTAASSRLNLGSDKLHAALFWFYNGSNVDEPAFEAIKVGDFDEAINRWSKLISSSAVTSRNASAYSNLGTLYLSGILVGRDTYADLIEKGISLKLKFFESDFFRGFKDLITDETYKVSNVEAQVLFLNQIILELESNDSISRKNLIDIVIKQEFSAKEKFRSIFADHPISQIESAIEITSIKRKEDKKNGIVLGRALVENSKKDLMIVKTVLGGNSTKFITIADKLANEILQCSIDYYNLSQNNNVNHNFVQDSIALAKAANEIAEGTIAKDRISSNLKVYEKMKDFELSSAIDLLQHIHDSYQENSRIGRTLDWTKVAELILKTIPPENVDKIKSVRDVNKLTEYKKLVDFVVGHLNLIQLLKIKHICYWQTENTGSYIVLIYKSLPVLVKVILWYLIGLFLIAVVFGEEAVDMVLSVTGIIAVLLFIGWIKS